MTEPLAAELSRPIAIDRIGGAWRTVAITADDGERAALAARFGLIALPALTAEIRLRRARAGRYVELDGSLQASVVQTCVVTLEPVPAALDERFALLLGPIGGATDPAAGSELIVDLDEPEPLDDDTIDIGELVAQQLSLALDPYPRAPDAPSPESLPEALAETLAGEAGAAARSESPFAVLRARIAEVPGAGQGPDQEHAPKAKPKAK